MILNPGQINLPILLITSGSYIGDPAVEVHKQLTHLLYNGLSRQLHSPTYEHEAWLQAWLAAGQIGCLITCSKNLSAADVHSD